VSNAVIVGAQVREQAAPDEVLVSSSVNAGGSG